MVTFCETAHSAFPSTPRSKVLLHSDDHPVFTHCDVLKRRPHLIDRASLLLQVLGTCTLYCSALTLLSRYHVRLNEWGC